MLIQIQFRKMGSLLDTNIYEVIYQIEKCIFWMIVISVKHSYDKVKLDELFLDFPANIQLDYTN